MTHTPGPWFRNISPKYPIFAGPRGNHTHVASVLSKPEYAEGDLRLIAAAPELLEALKSIVADSYEITEAHIIAARAAIAKATGAP